MPTLFNKVDQFWRGIGETSHETSPMRRASISLSRPPLPPSSKSKNTSTGSSSSSKNKNKGDERKAIGRPPVPTSPLLTGSINNGKFDRSRRCYSSLALNGSRSSKNKLTSMSGSIVDIYEFCKSQASRKFSYQSDSSSLKSKNKARPFSGSTTSVCGYPSIKEEVISERLDRNSNEKSITDSQYHYDNDSENTKTTPRATESQCKNVDLKACEETEEQYSKRKENNEDQWVRDGLGFERLSDHDNSCPAEEKTDEQDSCPAIEEHEEESVETLKMRWHKLGSSSSTSASFSDRRPKSFDYAQRKAWMKLYRDMEVLEASGSNNPAPTRISRPISKGSITHLHLQEASSSDHINCSKNFDETGQVCKCEFETDSASMSTGMRSSADISETSPSLFKRFSKTFSLRFGSGSNVSKHAGDVHRKVKSKGAIGSSPDLFNRVDVDGSRDKVNGKMRKTNVKSVRGDKCQSGDSGIGMEDQQTEARQVSNLRRIRSDYISSSAIGASPAVSSYTSRQHSNTSALAKLSLVEIPDHSWDEHNGSPNEGSGISDTASYEELVDAKLDRDDGFSSSDEGHQIENPTYYHTLPHRKHNKRRLKETESANSCGGDGHQEDNSIRGKVVREIIHTEQNYVKTLNDIVQGFLNPCRARNDLFSSRTVQNIFSNIEEILRLHVKFLEALKSMVDPTYVSKSNVGAVFTSWADKFSLYSEYCCNNPISVATVRSLVQFPQYAEFFEACRRLQMMDKLPLHGFLLRPIQRICQYHLQLNELLKHTEESHTDHDSVVEALETMKSVATKINDTQRQFESLQEIIRFQNSIDGWEGPNLVDRNSVILRKGELVKVTHGRKQKEVFVAILNKDLIYCKKDFMKKSGYVFDGRIDLNLRMWINIDSNEEDEFFGMVHNSWRMYSPERRAWILFTAPSPTEKRKWISALEKTKEDIRLDPKLREMAVLTTALSDSEMMYGGGSQGHHSNTLPKSNKKTKGKHLSVTKVDSDAMLIEVGKLKRSTITSNPNPSNREGTSKFYV